MFIKVLTVSQITNYIKRILTSDVILNRVSVKGEISNFKHHYSGHLYFTLKDDNARIKCVMFKSSAINLKFEPEDGMSVIVNGSVSLYERDGQYQLYVDNMQPDGLGALYMAFEQLKRKLESEGIFDKEHKIPIPKYPSKIGVVTSSAGAALRDILNIISRRYPIVDVLVYPVLVQGEEAPGQIASAIYDLNKMDDIDVIIVGRGGGSIEELWAFNEECVARAIYDSKIPVISAVGHETDFTISDFAADLRAPTPSAAAELCVPDKKSLIYKLNSCFDSLISLMAYNIKNKKYDYEQQKKLLYTLNPILQINQKRQYLDSMYQRLVSLMKYKLDMKRETIKKCSLNLDNLSPLSIISRGYAIAYMSDRNTIIDDVKRVKKGDNIDVLVNNGTLSCNVKDVTEEDIYGKKGKGK